MSGAFSHSRLTLLDDCPRRYRYRYVERLAEAFQSAEAFMGTMVHEALQWLYLEREERREPSEAEAVERYRATWAARHGPSIRVVQDDGLIDAFLADGEEMIRRHHRTTFADDRLRTLAIEPKVTITLHAGDAEASYVGYIDRLAQDAGGMMHVIDYKTSRRAPASFAEAGLQVRGYGLAVLDHHGGLEVGLRYEYLRPGTRLQEVLRRADTPAIAEALRLKVIRALEAERIGEFPARPSALCRWCGYREACDASPFHAGASAAAGAPAPVLARAPSPQARAADACPLCGGGLRLRSGSRGDLVACERYPDCLHARDASDGDRGRYAAAALQRTS